MRKLCTDFFTFQLSHSFPPPRSEHFKWLLPLLKPCTSSGVEVKLLSPCEHPVPPTPTQQNPLSSLALLPVYLISPLCSAFLYHCCIKHEQSNLAGNASDRGGIFCQVALRKMWTTPVWQDTIFRADVTTTLELCHLSWTRVIDNDFNNGCLCLIKKSCVVWTTITNNSSKS